MIRNPLKRMFRIAVEFLFGIVLYQSNTCRIFHEKGTVRKALFQRSLISEHRQTGRDYGFFQVTGYIGFIEYDHRRYSSGRAYSGHTDKMVAESTGGGLPEKALSGSSPGTKTPSCRERNEFLFMRGNITPILINYRFRITTIFGGHPLHRDQRREIHTERYSDYSDIKGEAYDTDNHRLERMLERAVQKNHETNKRKDTSSMWDEQDAARKFYRMSYEKNGERVNLTLAGLALTPESRVLDVGGSGPGAITIPPLARKVSHVTAVEPSEGMFTVLRENLEDEKITNADCLQKRWEDVDVAADLSGPYDVVFASFSLDVPPDMKAAITKMCELHRSMSISTGLPERHHGR